MQIAEENGLEFIDLKLKIVEGKQILMCIRNQLKVLLTQFRQHATYTKTSIMFQKILLLDYDAFVIMMKSIISVPVNIRII